MVHAVEGADRRDETWDTSGCSMARALDVIGDRWSILILRDTFRGIRRFEQIRRDLQIPRAVLSDRLATLVDSGVLQKRQYLARPPRYEYRLTAMGRELSPVLVGLMQWGDRWLSSDGAPTLLVHDPCGTEVVLGFHCDTCDADFGPTEISGRPGPGASTAPGSSSESGSTLAPTDPGSHPHTPGVLREHPTAERPEHAGTPGATQCRGISRHRRRARADAGPVAGPLRYPRPLLRHQGDLLPEGVHPTDHAVPRPLWLLHLRPAAGPTRCTVPRSGGGDGHRPPRSPRRVPRSTVHPRRSPRGTLRRRRALAGGARIRQHDRLPGGMAGRVLAETGLLPHANPGALGAEELHRLRVVAPSQGMMVETLRPRPASTSRGSGQGPRPAPGNAGSGR